MSSATHWTAIDEGAGLFQAERWDPAGWNLRSVAITLPDGGVAVVSPLRDHGAEAHDALARLGGARALIAPNHYHHLGLADSLARFPDAMVVCSERAAPRLTRKAKRAFSPLDRLRERLPAHVEIMAPPGLSNGEVWARVATARGVAWVVSDAFFHFTRMPRGAAGLFCRLTLTAPGLAIGRTFTGLAVGDRAAYRAFLLDRIERDRPRLLVPGHGDVLEADDLPDRLREVVARRLS